MKMSLFSRIFGGYLLVTVMISFFIPVLSFQAIKRHYVEQFADNLKNLAIVMEPEITTLLREGRIRQLDEYAKTLEGRIHTRVTIIDRDGRVLADSERDPATMDNHKGRPEVAAALGKNTGTSVRFSTTVDEEMLYVALPIIKSDRVIAVIRMSAFLKEINRLLSDLRVRILELAFAITLISLVVALMISRGISKPVGRLVQAARGLARGDFTTRISVTGQEELKELADSFNEMASKVRGLIADLTRRNEELGTIISSIQEVLIVLNRDGSIKLSNDSFKQMTGEERPEGRFFWEVIRSPGFDEMVSRVKSEKKPAQGEIELNERIYLCSATFLSSKDEIVTVCHDITDLKNLEKMKKDFVANISHELRTPLTAIKGFVETLEEEEEIRNVRYLEIIKRHTDRLMNIVKDLLVLSELEEKGTGNAFEGVELRGLVENILKIFEQRAKEKGLTLTLHAEEGDWPILADSFKLEQMFVNLIDNAVKYTESGGITITLARTGGAVRITVEDTGIGIPSDHLKRVFERFYVVDKSRSKKLGGTGLGLSIVKHIVLMHDGTIDVESTQGKGTRFVITLPTGVRSR